MNKIFIVINLTIVFILVGILSAACGKSDVQNNSKQNNNVESLKNTVPEVIEPPVPVPAYDNEKVNKNNFEKIKIGMTEDEVIDIFDGTGEPLTTAEDFEQGKEIYQLDTPDGKSKIFITFKKGKVSEKKAVDLK